MVASVRGYGVAGQAYFAAIWDKSAGPAFQARHGMTSAQYQTTFDQLLKEGYRLLWVSGYTVNGTDYYAAIWDTSAGPAWEARHRMTSTEYQTTFDQLGKQGYRLRCVSGYEVNGASAYAAIWDKATGPSWEAHHGMTSAQYQATFDKLLAEGDRLLLVDGYAAP